MPVPRRYDRRPPERDQTRINDRIRVPEVRLVGEDGKQIGVLKTSDALAYAQERDLDLVEVAPDARPPVCRVLDYSKFKYEQAQKQKAARKHQQQITIREIKFRPKIAQNDYDTKKGHVQRFLLGKDKVKITIMFRGREVTHPERGVALLEKLAGELAELATVEQNPLQDGRNMTMMLAPSKAVLAAETKEQLQALIGDALPEDAEHDERLEDVDAETADEAQEAEPEPAKAAEDSKPAKGAAAAKSAKGSDGAKPAEATKAAKPEEASQAAKPEKASSDAKPEKAAAASKNGATPAAEDEESQPAEQKKPRHEAPAASVGGGSRPAKRGQVSEADNEF